VEKIVTGEKDMDNKPLIYMKVLYLLPIRSYVALTHS
jgi:hypothetical protein